MGANLDTYKVGAHFEDLDDGVLLVPLESRYTQFGFNLLFVQVCMSDTVVMSQLSRFCHLIILLANQLSQSIGSYLSLRIH